MSDRISDVKAVRRGGPHGKSYDVWIALAHPIRLLTGGKALGLLCGALLREPHGPQPAKLLSRLGLGVSQGCEEAREAERGSCVY